METLHLLEETPATSPATNGQPRNLRTPEKPEIVAELEVAHGNPAKPHSPTQRRWCYPDDGSDRDL